VPDAAAAPTIALSLDLLTAASAHRPDDGELLYCRARLLAATGDPDNAAAAVAALRAAVAGGFTPDAPPLQDPLFLLLVGREDFRALFAPH
jgi:hypothetical protein